MSKPGAQAIAQSLKDLKDLVESIKTEVLNNNSVLTNLVTSVVAVESRIAEMETASKTAGVKRAVRSTTTAKETNTAPKGTKFPGSSFVWFGYQFKNNPDEVVNRYFTDAHTTQANTVLDTDPKYKADLKKLDDAPDNKKEAVKRTLISHKCRAYWNVVRNPENADVKNKITQDYEAKKTEWQKENQTPAKKDEDTETS